MRITIPPVLWAQRVALVAIAVIAPWNSVATHSSPVNAVIISMGWISWAVSAVSALAVIPVGLTALRMATPVVTVMSGLAVFHGSHRVLDVIAVACAAFVLWSTFTSSLAAVMVQGSAFGKEQRFPLRTPLPYIAPAVVSWLLLMSSVIAGPLLLAARSWILGVIVTSIGIALASRVPRRLHRLSRRWLVIVPAGIVVHDHMVLAETMMVRSHEVGRVSNVPTPGDEADLTGGVLGPRVRVDLVEATKVVLTGITAKTLKTSEALHVRSFSIAPRPHSSAVRALTTRSRSN